ncbi:ABC transporter ATP-binding protein [Devosia marina]|uniref:ATP-binding cassette domain-containing protein n=1 Tax=Devosia marina TaxID=2683198 RepID=A0A7X3K4H0_9HYPH|nr:ABC transporter ATP-binding protein [Devosia marina]MVT00372.1 ATP-binding cassette domain-containing protein [Devosia marina]
MATVSLDNVSKSYGAAEVIDNLSLTIDDGAFTVFVGPSGCGKSTLLRMIAGLEPITSGSLLIDGAHMNDADPIERGVAMVFQNYALYPHMSVEQNIGFSLRMAGLSKQEIAERVALAAKTLQIEQLLKRKPSQLSGGQRQRVAIGRAIVRDPEVFLFDEPLSNLDAELRVSMRVEIAKLHSQLGSTMIYVTHDQTEAMTLADKIVVMRDGRIEQAGTPEELYENPDNQFVAGFIGSPRMNFISGREGDTSLTLGVRPEHFQLGRGDMNFTLTVDVVENLGGTRYLYGTTSDGDALVVEAREAAGIKARDVVEVSVPLQRVYKFQTDGQRVRQ